MKKAIITFSNGTAFLQKEEVEIEDWEGYSDALDKLVDTLEKDGDMGYFVPSEELQDTDPWTYITAGNHCLSFRHNGHLEIEIVEGK